MSFFDSSVVEKISDTSVLLQLFAHRNKNQHRRSIWWRHFSIFRRQVHALEHDLKQLTNTPATHVERTKLKRETPMLKARVEQRIESWPVAQWQHAFSQLMADGRFAQLGLVLLAALAQICALMHITTHLEALSENEIQQALNDFGREHWQGEQGLTEDVGAVVARDTATSTTPTEVDTARRPRTATNIKSKAVRTKRRRRTQ
ncbi:hypothetical protein AMS68_005357 [Peltaster fructicola]|uniref:RNase MRP protein 1 RNA binding domain-containing protein n=1 Tax=Peltaster fructicola TaxID=286661 RepID=A0A6H0XZK3_9PEZI|nr:hypothetical protein AMS68_005357 [Peltaster fructicola]